jgi:regulator of protease activity HflC (stomatin/prohibitin superfamily)
MTSRLDRTIEGLSGTLGKLGGWLGNLGRRGSYAAANRRGKLVGLAVLAAIGYVVWSHPPFQSLERGEIAVRTNRFTGDTSQFSNGTLLALPGVHQVRRFSTRDQVYRPEQSVSATGSSPFQSVEGLSIGVDLNVRYAIDPRRIAGMSRNLPDDISGEVVQPIVQGVIYRLFASYTVREIFSSKRAEIQQQLENQLRPRLAADGILLRSVQMGKVDLPQDYRNGMDKLLAEELDTLDLKDKRVKETALDGEAEKVRREKAAEAAAREQVIAARGQEEAMRHVLPFKQKQIEQRQLEAEAEKVSRIRMAEGMSQARQIEAAGEAASRQKLADAEVYRLDRVGKVNSEQMEREGALITTHPLLIQKTLVDKLSDKVQVIIAAPPADGGFIGSNLIGSK